MGLLPATKIVIFRKDEELLQLILEGEAERRKSRLEEAEGKEVEDDDDEEESSAEEEDVDEAVGSTEQLETRGFYLIFKNKETL